MQQLEVSTRPHLNFAHEPGEPILSISDVTVRYPGSDRSALEHISFELEAGERVAVVGPNGAGKSTLFKVIAGVLEQTEGDVTVFGHGPDEHICIAYVPQRSQVDWSFPVNVADVVMMGRVGKLGLFSRPKAEDRDYVRQCLETVRMNHLAGRQISELSGGQQQRMFIARALAQEAELMLMDEPLSGLDLPSQDVIYSVLDELQTRGVTVMVATHDLHEAAERYERVMLLNRRLIGFGPPTEVLSADHLTSAYGGHLQLIETNDGLLALGDTCCGGGVE